MDVRSVFLVASGIAVGAIGGYSGSGLTARAGVVSQSSYTFGDAASAPLVSGTIAPIVIQATNHANNAERLNGALVVGGCPIAHVHFWCNADDQGAESWRWEYRTKVISKTEVWGEPQ